MPIKSITPADNDQFYIPHVSDEEIKIGAGSLYMPCFRGGGLLYPKLEIASKPTPEVQGNKIVAETSAIKTEILATPITKGLNEWGGLDLIITLPKKPQSNTLVFDYDAQNLRPFFQPELTAEEIADGCERPDHVINSIAWYHTSKGGTVTPSDVANRITTGKAQHWYRPQLVDADGKTVWADWLILNSSQIGLVLDEKFLAEATYPITIKPTGDTFGYTTLGSSDSYLTNLRAGSKFNCPAAGTGVSISWGNDWNFSGKLVKCCLYGSDENKVTNGETEELTSGIADTWVTHDFNSSPTLANADYWLIFWANSNYPEFKYDSVGGWPYLFQAADYGAWPASISMGSNTGCKYSIYCTYTAGGGPTTYELSVSDGIKIGDTPSESMVAGVAVADGIKAGDSPTGLGEFQVSASDGFKIGDSLLMAIAVYLQVSDGLKAGDTPSAGMTASPVVADGLKGGDSPTPGMTASPSVSDGVKAGDSPSAGMEASPSVSDGLKVGDTTLAQMVATLSVSDGVKLCDLAELLASMDVEVADGVKFGDLTLAELAAAGEIFLELTDGIKVGDTPLADMLANLQVTDGVKLSDSPAVMTLKKIITAISYFHKRSANSAFHKRSADQVFHKREADQRFN